MLAEQRPPQRQPVASAGDAPPVGVRKSTRYFAEVESLRGIAILLVFFLHANGWVVFGGYPSGSRVSLLAALAGSGHTGVSLFFVLSGFLLSMPFIAEAFGGKRVSRADYFRRRALRILPVYYVAVVVGSALSATTPWEVLRGVPYLLFLNGVPCWGTPLPPYSNVWWSLATEVQFYCVVPLLSLFLRTRVGRISGVVVLAVYGVALLVFLASSHATASPGGIDGALDLGHSLFGRGFLFIFGGAAAWIYLRYGETIRVQIERTRWLSHGGADLLLVGLILAQMFLLRWQVYFGYWHAEASPAHLWHVAEGLLWTGILLVLVLAPVRTKAIFCNRVLSWIGVLSYSLYLVHVPVQTVILPWLRTVEPARFNGWNVFSMSAVLAVLVGSLGMSEIAYRAIEQPFLRRKAKIDR